MAEPSTQQTTPPVASGPTPGSPAITKASAAAAAVPPPVAHHAVEEKRKDSSHLAPQSLEGLDPAKLHPLSPEVISRQATINIGMPFFFPSPFNLVSRSTNLTHVCDQAPLDM